MVLLRKMKVIHEGIRFGVFIICRVNAVVSEAPIILQDVLDPPTVQNIGKMQKLLRISEKSRQRKNEQNFTM